jgi:hypothetical protein
MLTAFFDRKLAAVRNLDHLHRLVAGAFGHVLDLVDDLIAFEDFAEDDVAAIEPASDDGGDEELGTVGILARVRLKSSVQVQSLHLASATQLAVSKEWSSHSP